MAVAFPTFRSVVLDTMDARGLAEFYRELLGYDYRSGDEPPVDGTTDERGEDWLVLLDPAGVARLAFQQVRELPRSTWPQAHVPQQVHLDLSVPTIEDLRTHHARALSLGAQVLFDRSNLDDEPLYVYADPAGHPFCIFVASSV